jgi:hypothetical protein
MATCKVCQDTGFVYDSGAHTCKCRVLRRVRERALALAPGAEAITPGMLNEGAPIEGSCFCHGPWQKTLNDLAGWCLYQKAHPRVLVTSTAELRVSYVGNELPNVLAGHDLVVVRVLGSRNKLLADILEEVVVLAKGAVWLCSDRPLSGGSAWSEGLASVTEKFQTVRSAAKDDLDDLFHDDEEAAK